MELLKNKTAIITGAGTGIGLAIAQSFHAQGAYVVICGRREEVLGKAAKAISPQAERILSVPADITKETDIARLVKTVREKRGAVDILVNNAGIMRFGRLEDADQSLWDQLLKTNTYAPWRLSVEVIPLMQKAGGGSIVNISSIAGIKALPGAGVYCTSKAALQMLSQVMALEHASDQIRVNLICPGLVEDTELADPIFGKKDVQDFYQKLRPLHPLGRSGKPKDIADTALFLASQQSSWITGAVIPVDGGRHMATNRPEV